MSMCPGNRLSNFVIMPGPPGRVQIELRPGILDHPSPGATRNPCVAALSGRDGIGKVQAQIQKYDQAIAVVSQRNRSSLSVECNGVCYLPISKPIAWKSDPGEEVRLALY